MPRRPHSRRHAVLICATALMTLLVCGGICAAAVLVPAPPAVVPFVAALCICCPMLVGLELPGAIAKLRDDGERGEARALEALRRGLDRLPEVEHPLGL